MTGNNRKEIIRVLCIAVFLFAVVIPLFWYRARQHSTAQKRSVQETIRKEARAVWEDSALARVSIAGAEIQAEVVRSAARKAQGLSGRAQLGPAEGMLFLFEEKGVYSFWNKDMRFALDVLWIDGDTVVDISENLPAFQGAPAVLTPSAEVDKVLEVNAGFVSAHGVKKGDRVGIYK